MLLNNNNNNSDFIIEKCIGQFFLWIDNLQLVRKEGRNNKKYFIIYTVLDFILQVNVFYNKVGSINQLILVIFPGYIYMTIIICGFQLVIC